MCSENYVTCSAIYPVYFTLNEKLNAIDLKEDNDSDNIDYLLSREIKKDIYQTLSKKYNKPEMKILI